MTEILEGPINREYNERELIIKDLNGLILCFGEEIKSPSKQVRWRFAMFIGKTYVFDYGEFIVQVNYPSSQRLRWIQIKGPDPGSTDEETYNSMEIRKYVHMFSWKEKDNSVIVQVVDWEMNKVHTTWIAPDRTIQNFQGAVREIR